VTEAELEELLKAGEGALENDENCLCHDQTVASVADIVGRAVLKAAADRLQARGNQIAAAPPDPHLDPRAGVNYLVAEGWYQAADWLWPKETR
jgi:hypothetical protein